MANNKAINSYKTVNSSYVEDLVRENMDLVKKAVYSISKNLPKYIEEDDLMQVGYIGLVKAAQNYTGENGAKFSTYAYYRVRGSIYDEIRSSDWKPRRAQKRTKLIALAVLSLEKDGNEHPSDQQIANLLDIDIPEYNKWVKETSLVKIVPMATGDGEHLDVPDESKSLASSHESLELQTVIKDILKTLPTQTAQIVSLYYNEDLSFKDIGYVMDMPPSKCARIFKKSLSVIKEQLAIKGYTNG
jgi:RNA polymerase sigma factor for flagellar operon FliA